MEKEMNDNESRMFDLLESKDFSALTAVETAFVLSMMPEEEYEFQRKIMVDSSSVFDEEIEPVALILPHADSKSKKQLTVPLYQSLLAIASVIIFFIIIWPDQTRHVLNSKNDDTLHPEKVKTEYIHDTVVQYVNNIKTVEKIVYDTVKELITLTEFVTPDNRLLEASNSINIPELTTETILTKGTSLKDDQGFRLTFPVVNSR